VKRSSDTDDGSLDLLLDTICNTFGGVLFISMLVVILLGMSSRQAGLTPPDPEAQAALEALERDRSQSAAKLRTLRSALAIQQQIERQIDDPGLRATVRRLHELQAARDARSAQVDAARAQISQAQIEVNRITRSLADARSAHARAAAELQQAEQELEREMSVRTRTARLPRLRPTIKTEVPFFLRQGRLSALLQPAPAGGMTRNTAESTVRTDAAGLQLAEPVPGAGTPVRGDGSARAAVEQRIAQFNRDRHFIAVVVWPDSFAEFAVVKDILVRQGFEYRLMPWPDGEPIPLGGSTAAALVQ
jgi:hypothetical protein